LEREVAHSLVDAAHQTCPYSKATRGNVDVTINVAISQPIQQTEEIHQ
jgi:organic hydroperoxide reductase OsmC/OhrA